MTPTDIKALRRTLQLSASAMARVLGYHGPHAGREVRRLEAGDKVPTATMSRLLRLVAWCEKKGYRWREAMPPDDD